LCFLGKGTQLDTEGAFYGYPIINNNRNTMPFEKGVSGNPSGRPKGSINERTNITRQIYGELVESNLSNISSWFKVVGKENPELALKVLLKLTEFVIPKLSRIKSPKVSLEKVNTCQVVIVKP